MNEQPKNEQPKDEQPNYFMRVLLVLIILFVSAFAVFSFLYGKSHFELTNGIIALLLLVAALAVSESFNSISIGTLFQLRREVKRVEKEKDDAKSELKEVRNSFMTLAASFHQSQSNNTISVFDQTFLRRMQGVVPASPEEAAKDKDEALPLQDAAATLTPQPEEAAKDKNEALQAAPTATPVIERALQQQDLAMRRRVLRELETDLFSRFATKFRIPELEIRREVKFDSSFQAVDPIMTRSFVYDGYVKQDQREYFIEVLPRGSQQSLTGAYRLYVSIARVLFYRQTKQAQAELVLICADLPDDQQIDRTPTAERFLEWFQPAIANGLLRIERFPYSVAEYEQIQAIARGNA